MAQNVTLLTNPQSGHGLVRQPISAPLGVVWVSGGGGRSPEDSLTPHGPGECLGTQAAGLLGFSFSFRALHIVLPVRGFTVARLLFN